MKRLAALLMIACVVAGCAQQPCGPAARRGFEPRGTGDFNFVVLGDSRPWTKSDDGLTQNQHFLENILRTNVIDPDFVVNVGDLIRRTPGDEAYINRQWDAYDEMCRRFNMPCVSIPGNHDVFDEMSQQIWERRYGLAYFSWNHKGCHFVALNSEVVGEVDRIAGEQLQWLKADLDRSAGARRIFVLVHKPLWAYKPAAGQAANAWMTDVHPLLVAAGVDAVFAGHWHRYTLDVPRDGVRYVVTGGGGTETDRHILAGGFFHVLDVAVAGGRADWEVVTAWGRAPADCVTKDRTTVLGRAVAVEPLSRAPADGRFQTRAHVKNLTDRRVKVSARWEAAGTTWRGEQTSIVMEPDGEAILPLRAAFGKDMLPLPALKIVMTDERGQLFEWSVMNQAVSRLNLAAQTAKPTAATAPAQ